MSAPYLGLKLSKSYPGFRLEVDAAFPGGITAIFGPSGSGKTTVLNCIAGLAAPDGGEIRLRDRPLFSTSERVNLRPERRRVGYMFQESLLFPHVGVWDNILYGYKMTPKDRRRVEPMQLVELLDLGRLLERRPVSLSTGERQRVALARALATSPELLLLDEPLSSLDLALRGRILRYLKDLHRRLDIPMVYVSHSISEVLALADTALVLSRGSQVALGDPRDVLLDSSVHSLVEVGSLENLLDVQVVGNGSSTSLRAARMGEAELWVSGVPSHTSLGDVISISIRAGDIIVAVDRPQRISARNILAGRIQGIHRVEDDVLLYTDAGAPLLVQITPEALESLDLREGQEVYLVIKSSSIRVLD